MDSVIEDVRVRKILDSRGNPTVEVDIITWNGFGRAAAPSGASTGSREVVSFPEGGVSQVITEVEDLISSELIGMAADHAGYELKEALKPLLNELGFEVKDFGTHSVESMDYPDVAHPLAEAIENGEVCCGVAMCGSANGISMTLNKHQGIRAAICWNPELASLARQHNDANILSLPARFISQDEAKEIVKAYFAAEFEGGRHQRRVEKIACK